MRNVHHDICCKDAYTKRHEGNNVLRKYAGTLSYINLLLTINQPFIKTGILFCILTNECKSKIVSFSSSLMIAFSNSSHSLQLRQPHDVPPKCVRPCKGRTTAFIQHKISNRCTSISVFEAARSLCIYVKQLRIQPAVRSSSHLVPDKIGWV